MSRLCCLASVLTVSLVAFATGGEPILLCGADEVFEIDAAAAAKGKIEKTWRWKAAQCNELPEALRRTFATTDDCKPVDGGAKVLVSSSSGGCALVARPSGKALWYAQVPNAHSLEMLPGDRIVVASSVHAQGNRLVLFDVVGVFDLVDRRVGGVQAGDRQDLPAGVVGRDDGQDGGVEMPPRL